MNARPVSSKQRRALEKITGKHWDIFSPIAIDAYFALTDRGEQISCDDPDFYLLMEYHRQHPVTIEMWKSDFRSGLLFLWDFLQPEYPQPYIQHAFKVYASVFNYIPYCYREHPLAPKEFR